MYRQLSHEERKLISTLKQQDLSLRQIALLLDRAPSTISRELKRNTYHKDGSYRFDKAHQRAVTRRRKSHRVPHYDRHVMARVMALIRRRWSPVQITGALRLQGKPVPSHETIYRFLRRDKNNDRQLTPYTRILSKVGRKHYRSPRTRGILAGKRHISERPTSANKRLRFGHWEADTVIGKGSKHCLLTLVERKSGYAFIGKLSARTKDEVTRALSRIIARQPDKFKTITFDNGTEFHDYALLEQRFKLACYFATPYHSWERGSNENLNGLIRQYAPKRTCLRHLTQAQCSSIARQLNQRPRKRFNFKTPMQVYNAS